jgi:ribosome-associated translation inhibitor RaiA
MIPVQLTAEGVPSDEAKEAVARMEGLDAYAGRPLTGARLTLRRGSPRSERPFVADAHVIFGGRVLAAHTTGRAPLEAADAAAERLRRQMRRIVESTVARRNEPAAIRQALAGLDLPGRDRPAAAVLKPPEERQIVRRRMYVDAPLPTLDAVADLLDLDVQFLLFRHARTEEEVVVHRRDDGAIGLLFPEGSVLADEDDIVVPEPSRYSEPLGLAAARAEQDALNHRFLYFTDADDGRGKVLYLRHDGDLGLVEPG